MSTIGTDLVGLGMPANQSEYLDQVIGGVVLSGVAGTDNVPAFQRALAASNGRLSVSGGEFRMGSTWPIANDGNLVIQGQGPDISKLVWDFAGHTQNCIEIDNQSFYQVIFRDLTLDFNSCGLDGVSLNRGVPIFENCRIVNAYRDAHSFTLPGLSYWIENAYFRQVLWEGIGRHVFKIAFSNNTGPVPFFNETLIEHCEVRGIGRRYADSNIIRVVWDGTTDSVVTLGTWRFLACNWDGQQAASLNGNSLGDVVYLESANGGTGVFYGYVAEGGAWESTSGSATSKKLLKRSSSNITVTNIRHDGLTYYQWASAVDDELLNLASTYDRNASGIYLPDIKSKPNGRALYGDGSGLIENFKNAVATFRKVVTLPQSGTVNIDIPIKTLAGTVFQSIVEVTLSKPAFQGVASVHDTIGTYYVIPNRSAGSNGVKAFLVFKYEDTGVAYGFDPDIGAGVAFSMLDDSTLRVAVTGGASVGTSGSQTSLTCTAHRKGVIPEVTGDLTTLTL